MKKKFSSMGRVAIALVLALSLSLVMAGPTAADSPADTDVGYSLSKPSDGAGTAEWSTEHSEKDGAMGAYSVELIDSGSSIGELHVELIPAEAITLSDLQALTNDWSFGYYFTTATECDNGPQLELKFENPARTEFVDFTIMALQGDTGSDVWDEVVLAADLISVGYFGSVVGFEAGAGQTLADAIAAVLTDDPDCGDWELTTVQVEMELPEDDRTAYIDDITIDGTTYELEPIFMDAEYYSVGDTIEVTVPNFAANLSSIRTNPIAAEEEGDDAAWWQVIVTSNSDSVGIIVDLEETGANTGVFTGSFTTEGTLPVTEDELYVQDGDTITVTYGGAGVGNILNVDWGPGETDVATILTAMVDITDPTIDTPVPVDGDTTDDATPLISANYNGGTSAIDQTSVEMFVDSVDVTSDATVGASSVSYTPEDELAEGSHDVTVNVSDNAGNEATLSWSFRVASWLVDPVGPTTGDSLDELEDVGVAVSGAGTTGIITVGRYASNPQPEAPPAFDMIENGFFDVRVTDADTTQIVIKFAATGITAESTAHVWDDLEGAWLECSDQGYNSLDEYLWVKVRTDTTPNIAELTGTPFAIGGELAVEEISAYYKGYSGDAEVVETTDLLKAANDWADAVVPSGFTEAISTTQLLALANEWAATE